MGRRRHRVGWRRAAAAAGLLACALVLGACNGGDPEEPPETPTEDVTTAGPTTAQPSEPPTEEETTEVPTADYQAEQIASAREFVILHYQVIGEVGADGFEEWFERMSPFYGGADDILWQQVEVSFSSYEEQGLSTEGQTEVYSIATTRWVEDLGGSGYDSVSFQMCLDSRSVRFFELDGSERPSTAPDHRYPAAAEVIGQPESSLGWSFVELEPDGSSTC